MVEAELGTLLELHKGTLKEMARSMSAGDRARFAKGAGDEQQAGVDREADGARRRERRN